MYSLKNKNNQMQSARLQDCPLSHTNTTANVFDKKKLHLGLVGVKGPD